MGIRKSRKPYGGGRTGRPPSKFLDTRGRGTLAVGVCQRCNLKFPLEELQDDPNIKGLKVCRADRDDYDPYRMPARMPEKIPAPYPRPDVGIAATTTPTSFPYTQSIPPWVDEENGTA